jgi:hypothetical protein
MFGKQIPQHGEIDPKNIIWPAFEKLTAKDQYMNLGAQN